MSRFIELYKTAVVQVHETIVSSYIPKEIEKPSFDSAKDLNGNSRWPDAADNLYSIARRSIIGSEDRGNALIGLAQAMHSLGSYRHAERCLAKVEEEFMNDTSSFGLVMKARIAEKRGWIANAFGKHDLQHKHFEDAIAIIRQIPDDDYRLDVEGIYETALHFTGREYETRAMMTNDLVARQQLLDSAMNNFSECLEIDRKYKEIGEPRLAGEGYQLMHMGICMAIAGDFARAGDFIEQAGVLFGEFSKQKPESNIMGHYYNALGIMHARQAHSDYEKQLQVYLEKHPYIVGEARARVGLAMTALAYGDLRGFIGHVASAVRSAPQILAQTV
jgi:tetratricopeptide (TPR) repeat protein